MSNIERRYAYYDEGVLPEEGEYGVTYLTLYSSNAGNIYDGWVWDPDGKVPESLTERTYGYRNPDYEDYCWDDEVVVDLSNAQNRQESSEFTQGRITSFNTNVSDRPIILQDIDITGLTEEERENKATTVLFSAIPLVQDAYIQAQVEVQCKCNLSPDNTSGEMRIEAFYILNDESDRTMRPNPVHTFSVSSDNERHTLPWLYWNPALRHQDHNYIGVKLIATGGTAEIGISDDPEYGDAMITLASAGLTGDHIDSGRPIYLEIFGKEEVVGGYELDPDDYTVLCTYDTGEIYEVTRMCAFDPPMGSPITEAITTLTAYYMGLRASMTIRLGMVESIEITGRDTFHSELMLKMHDYTVLAILDTGDIIEVTDECEFSPAMGTTINATTTLTATYTPYWMPGSSFTASLEIEKIGVQIAQATNGGGLTYTAYNDGPDTPAYIEVTGTSVITTDHGTWYECLKIPSSVKNALLNAQIYYYNIEWMAEGPLSGVNLPCFDSGSTVFNPKGIVSNVIGFEDVKIVPKVNKNWTRSDIWNPICINFDGNATITSDKLSFLKNIDMSDVKEGFYTVIVNSDQSPSSSEYFESTLSTSFRNCKYLNRLDFLTNIDTSRVKNMSGTFAGCEYLEDISGIKNLDVSNVENVNSCFMNTKALKDASDLYKWYLPKCAYANSMFAGSGLETCSCLGNMRMGEHNDYGGRVNYSSMFEDCKGIKRLNGLEHLIDSHAVNTSYMFRGCDNLEDISAASDWITSNVTTAKGMFMNCVKLKLIEALRDIDTSEITDISYMFASCPIANDGYINNWNVGRVENIIGLLSYDVNSIDETGWSGSNIIWSDYQSHLRGLSLYTLNPGNHKIALTNLRTEEWSEPNPQGGVRYPYYHASSSVFSGRDLIKVRYDNYGNIAGYHAIYSLPSWYRDVYFDALNDYFNLS